MSGVEPAANLSYSGQLTIVGPLGTLVIDDLGVLVEENERLQIFEPGDLVEDQVVGAEDRAGG